MKVRELKKLIENLEDDINIVTLPHNFELKNSIVDAKVSVSFYIKEKRQFTDAFDYTQYQKEVYKYDVNGNKTLLIYG